MPISIDTTTLRETKKKVHSIHLNRKTVAKMFRDGNFLQTEIFCACYLHFHQYETNFSHAGMIFLENSCCSVTSETI